MADLKKELLKFYKVYRTTGMVEDDIKSIKKINNLMYKYNNTQKDRYRLEAINILKTTANLVNFDDEFVDIIKKRIILPEHLEQFGGLLDGNI